MGLNFLKKANLSTKADDELMSLIAEGDSKAFETLFDRYSGKVLGYAKKMLGSVEKACSFMKMLKFLSMLKLRHLLKKRFSIKKTSLMCQNLWKSCLKNKGLP